MATPKSGKPPAGWPSTPCWKWSGEAWTPGRDTSEWSEVCFPDRHALYLCPTLFVSVYVCLTFASLTDMHCVSVRSLCISACLSHFCFPDRHALCLCLFVSLYVSLSLAVSVFLSLSLCLTFSHCLSFCLCVSHFLLLALSFCLSVSFSLTVCVSHFLLLCLLSLCAVSVSLPLSLLFHFCYCFFFSFFRLTLCCPRGNNVHSPVTVSGSVKVCIHL